MVGACSLCPDCGDSGPVFDALTEADKYGSTLSKKQEISLLLQAIKKSKSPTKERDWEGVTPLYYTASTGEYQKCRILLDAGADPIMTSRIQIPTTPIHVAAARNNLSIVRLMLSRMGGIEKPVRDPIHGTTLAEAAEKAKANEAARWLRVHGY